MLAKFKEPIRVATVFEPGGRVRPVWFEWNRRQHRISETTYTWKGKKGEAVLLHFTVTSGGDLFELAYNTADQTWTLERVETG